MLHGKVMIITGASRGIGKSIARLFAENGADVILNARDATSLKEACDEIRSSSDVRVVPLAFDVSDPEKVKSGFREIFQITKTLDILVNNAGILKDALLGMVTSQMIHEVFSINVFGTLYCCQYATRMMTKQKKGSIINISSIFGLYGNKGQAIYGGSKAAVIGITKSLAKEMGESNIRVNAIAPGFIDTDMTKILPAEKYLERLMSIKMNRVGSPQEVANVALFLASDMSLYVTGQIIGVDGGMII
ncbi:MAG TPA: 3-oxoacyl-ACP reductase [Nitrospiraceae bacterium]|nr:3-oxoacyl-ACP reductase [Nitrospiraceae bacterium]